MTATAARPKRGAYQWTESPEAIRKRNQRKYTAPSKLVVGRADLWLPPPNEPQLRATLMLPIRTKTEGNSRESWRMAQKRTDAQREVTMLLLNQLGAANWRTQVKRVKFVRLAPGTLDQGGNVCSSFKHIRDQIAAWMAGQNHPKGRGDDGPKCGVYWDEDNQEANPGFGVRVEFYL